MKKILAAALALCLLCGVAALASAASTFRVGVKQDMLGFSLLDQMRDTYEGFEVDLAYMLAEALGYDDVYFTTVTAATRGQMLDNDEVDAIIATFTIREERKLSWDFSTPYYQEVVTELVETASGITDLAGLKDKVVGVSSGSTSAQELATAMAGAGVIDAFDAASFDIDTFKAGVSFKQFGDYPEISAALSANEINAFCVDRSILSNYKTSSRSFIDATFGPQDYGVATKKGSELSAKIDELIVQWLEDGTIDELTAKWNI